GQRDAEHSRQIDVTDTPLGERFHVPAQHHETQRTDQRDRQAAGRRGGHRLLHGYAVPGQEGHGQRTAADADDCRNPTNHPAGGGQSGLARYLAVGLGAQIEAHLDGDADGEHANDLLQQRTLQRQGGQRTEYAADQNAQAQPDEDQPAHRATAVVLANRADRGERDGGQRGADRQVGEHFGRHALGGEAEDQHRDDDHPATDPEQAGQHTGASTKYEIEREYHDSPHDESGMVANP